MKITDLNAAQAREFLMKPEQFCTLELPDYFNFSGVLAHAASALEGRSLQDIVADGRRDGCTDANYTMLLNKDGRFGIRPITIANPYLYTVLINHITDPDNWQRILAAFERYATSGVVAASIPVVPEEGVKEPFYKSTTILNWWSQMEQTPIELSMQYRYMLMSDISNCFGQITADGISDALTFAGIEDGPDNAAMAGELVELLKFMQGGRIYGIPQGSTLFSFIAEIVLGYADLLLSRAVRAAGIKAEYRVVRYVDDYRIFCNDRNALEQISYCLQRVLEGLNMRLNPSKTRISESIIADAVKPDKAFYIFNTPVFNKKGIDFDGFQKHLYFIYLFGRRYPNCGQLKVQLDEYSRRLSKRLRPRKEQIAFTIHFNDDGSRTTTGPEERTITPQLKERIAPMVAICAQLAAENPACAHYALRVASQMLASMEDTAERDRIVAQLYERLRDLPNPAYMQIWLQTITYQSVAARYDNPLCRLVEQPDAAPGLWDNSWAVPALADTLPMGTIVDREKLQGADRVIKFRPRPDYPGTPEPDDLVEPPAEA